MEPNYASKLINFYMSCGIVTVVMGIILSIMGWVFEHCSET